MLVQLARAMSHADTQRSLAFTRPERVILCATDDTAARLEDLQDVLGEGREPTPSSRAGPCGAR